MKAVFEFNFKSGRSVTLKFDGVDDPEEILNAFKQAEWVKTATEFIQFNEVEYARFVGFEDAEN